MTRFEQIEARPTLRAWLEEYAAIEQDYLDDLTANGVKLAPRDHLVAESEAAKKRLAEKGANFRNGDASISINALSSACIACTGDCGSKTFFLSLACNRDCYFCFNTNQTDFENYQVINEHWAQEIDEFASTCERVTHIGLTGGEPLLHKQETIAFFDYVHHEHPDAHTRLYSAGDFFDEACLRELRDAGLQELRMSIKLDVEDGSSIVDDAIIKLELAKRFISDVMVEMPVIPGTGKQMRYLLEELDRIGVFGINLLEFGYPMGDWTEFGTRGFEVKNPPFSILYNYNYAGGVPIDGSELLCFELIEFALDNKLTLGLHYCSLDNKNRDQVLQQNRAYVLDPGLFAFDESDFFYKAIKVFDQDVLLVEKALKAAGVVGFMHDDQERSLLFHPDHFGIVADLPIIAACSSNVVEQAGHRWAIRELKLELLNF